jgi:hypothetical protein
MDNPETISLEPKPLKLDLGAGRNPQPGFTSVDLYAEDVDVKLDLEKFPWPWEDNSVSEIHCSHFVEHLNQELRWPFFQECYRILKPESIMRIIVPNFKSDRAYGDCTHKFPPVVPMSFYYLNKQWREANKLTYGPYDIKCNFDHQCGPAGITQSFLNRSHEDQIYDTTHYWDSLSDIWCTLTKRPM